MENFKITVSKEDLEYLILAVKNDIIRDSQNGINIEKRLDLIKRLAEALQAPFI